MPYQSPYSPNYFAPSIPTYMPQPPAGTYNQSLPIPSNSTQNPVASNAILLHGRVVQNEAEITPSEVVMDGSISIFPLADYSAIVCKQWRADGTIQTLRYIPEKVQVDETPTTQSLEDLLKHIDERFDLIEANLTAPIKEE